jgi:ribosomal protein S18 acetylase RimI-like enzyme
MIVIEAAATVTPELVDAFARLLPQLSASSPAPTESDLAAMIAAPGTRVLLARDDQGGAIVGTLTLVCFRIPTGIRAWIEDVIVDESARGKGVGEILTKEALRLAHGTGARTVDLTSSPSRQAANRLYQRLGFALRETNVYRCSPEGPSSGP